MASTTSSQQTMTRSALTAGKKSKPSNGTGNRAEEVTHLENIIEKRRLQNRISQRNYREYLNG
jgi:hypothetical protein